MGPLRGLKTTRRLQIRTALKRQIFLPASCPTKHHLKPALDEQGLNASPQLPDGVKNYD